MQLWIRSIVTEEVTLGRPASLVTVGGLENNYIHFLLRFSELCLCYCWRQTCLYLHVSTIKPASACVHEMLRCFFFFFLGD
jgi:hypothetical protein